MIQKDDWLIDMIEDDPFEWEELEEEDVWYDEELTEREKEE